MRWFALTEMNVCVMYGVIRRHCGALQVSNWFGNKRIRFKKNISKGQEEANMYAAKLVQQSTTSAVHSHSPIVTAAAAASSASDESLAAKPETTQSRAEGA